MKRNSTHLSQLLILPLLIQFSVPALALEPAVQNPGVVSSSLQTVASGMNMVSSFANGVGVSQQQMQAMVNQMNMANGTMSAQQTALTNIQMQIAQAQAEAQQCIDKEKFDAKKYKKFTIPPSSLSEDNITCTSYGRVIDSTNATIAKINQGQKQLACLVNMQNKIKQIADQAKVPFQSLTNAANESWNVRKQIIDMHTKISEKLGTDLEDYGTKLADLKQLSLDLNASINGGEGKAGKGDYQTSGLAKKIDDLKAKRIDKANQWYLTIMNKTQTCFFGDNTRLCEASGAVASPAACIAKKLNPAGSSGAAADRNGRNTAVLQQIFAANAGKLQSFGNRAALDIKNPEGFYKYTNTQFEKVSEQLSAGVSNGAFVGNVNRAELAAFFKAKLRECYNDTIKNFQSDMAAGGSEGAAADFNNIVNEERELSADMQNLIQSTTQKMNAFKTVFTKIYNSQLPQFDANCSASEDPYLQLDCVRILSASLKSGLSGTQQTVKLSNGTTYVSNEGLTTLNVQSVTFDKSGKPSMSTSQLQCRGFDDCMVFLQKQKENSDNQVSTQTASRETFVTEHNKNIDTTLGMVATQFTQVGTMLTAAITQLNNDFKLSGLTETVTTSPVAGEELEKDETTGLYKMPKDMKAALAGKGTYTEIDANDKFGTALDNRMLELKKILNKAYEMKGMCTIKDADYQSLANKIDCSNPEKFCKYLPSIITPLERLLRKSQDQVNEDEKDTISNSFKSCKDDAKYDRKNSGLSEAEVLATDDTKREALKIENKEKVEREFIENSQECTDQAFQSLADDLPSRDNLRPKNDPIVDGIKKLADSCATDQKVDVDACRDVKDKIANTKAPTDEGETILETESASKKPTNVLRAD